MVGLLFGQVIGRLPQLPNHLGIPIVDHFAQRIAVRMNRLLWCIAMQHTFQFIAFRIPNPVVQIAAVGSAPALGDGVVWGGGYFCTGMAGGKKRRKTLSGADLSEAGARKNLHQLLLWFDKKCVIFCTEMYGK